MIETQEPVADTVASLSAATLANVFDQSVDCVKLIGLDHKLQWMNANGLCAMEIPDFTCVRDSPWQALWPDGVRERVEASYAPAADGEVVRFRAFCPTYAGTPRWWDVTVSAVKNAAGEHSGYLAISRDVTESEQSREALDIAARELRHRLKNTHMMISSLITGFARGNAEKAAFARDMSDRLVALSRAQTLFADGDAPGRLDDLIDALVAPFDNDRCTMTVVDMPDVAIDQGRADAIALVIGELAVNSSKHGAIRHGGSIRLTGTQDGDGFSIRWAEDSLSPVEHHSRDGGQGLTLMRRIMAARGGSLATEWRDHGVDVTLVFTG